MIRFMICDTDTQFLDKLSAALHGAFDPCSVEYMYGPSALEVSLRADNGGGDVLLTEIELRGRSAIDIIGRYLKPSSSLQVLYMTSKMEYCTEVYETRHCGFLLKPIERGKLLRDVKRALRQLEASRGQGLSVRCNGSLHVIDTPTILYAESDRHMVCIVTNSEDLRAYETMGSLLYRLDRRFVRCHKGYVVNMERVRKFCGDHFVMENGEEIPISQGKRREVRETFFAYMGSAAGGRQRANGPNRE